MCRLYKRIGVMPDNKAAGKNTGGFFVVIGKIFDDGNSRVTGWGLKLWLTEKVETGFLVPQTAFKNGKKLYFPRFIKHCSGTALTLEFEDCQKSVQEYLLRKFFLRP